MDYLKVLKKRKSICEQLVARYQALGNPIPELLVTHRSKCAVLPAQIATVSTIDMQFFGLAKRHNLVPIWAEYTEDLFSGGNGRKVSYLHPRDKYGNQHPIARPKDWEGKRLSEILTHDGQTLVAYHHDLWEKEFSSLGGLRVDVSNWLRFFGSAQEYYYHEMVLATFFFVQCWPRNISSLYRPGEKEVFIENIMDPARKQVCAEFGVEPLELYFELIPTHLT